jgi:hypothetical protein
MRPDLASLLDRIRSLLDQRGVDPSKPLLTVMENTLTDGYARALQLEAERLRLEREIHELAHGLEGPEQTDRLRELAQRRRDVDEELASLRGLLAPLQERVDAERAA